jgi:hypothetical protein
MLYLQHPLLHQEVGRSFHEEASYCCWASCVGLVGQLTLRRGPSHRGPTARPQRPGLVHLARSPFFFVSGQSRKPEF